MVPGVIYAGITTPTQASAFGVTGAFVPAALLNSGEILTPIAGGLARRTGLIRLFTETAQETLRSARMPSRKKTMRVVKRNLAMIQDSLISTVRTTGMIFLILLAALTLSFTFARLGISQQVAEFISGLNLNDWQPALVIFYLLLGTFMESFAMMVTTIPVLLPALHQAGVDREHAEIANEMVKESTIKDVWIGVLPFMACMAAVTGLVLAFPQIALWLPNLVYGSR